MNAKPVQPAFYQKLSRTASEFFMIIIKFYLLIFVMKS